MALIRNGELIDDSYALLGDAEALPSTGAVLVTLARWRDDRDMLLQSGSGLRVTSRPS